MKSTQLLSVVLSMILVFGVTAGSAFAQTEDYDDDHEEYDRHDDLGDRLEHFCDMTGDEKRQFFADHPRIEQFKDRLANYCEMSEDERDDAIDEFIRENFPGEKEHDGDYDLGDLLDRFCAATDEDKRKLFADRPILEQFRDRLANYCEMSEDEQDTVEDLLENYKGEIKTAIKEHAYNYKKDRAAEFREKLENYCAMSDEDKTAYIAEHDKTEEHQTKMNTYCEADEDDRATFIIDNLETYKAHMKEKMSDKKHHIDYDKLCAMSESERAAEIRDVAKLDRISNWCSMTPDERADYKEKHHDSMKDKMGMMKDRMHANMECDCHKADDGTMSCPIMDDDSAMQCSMMDKHHDMKLSEKSQRLKAMIMTKYDVSDERMDEIKEKYREKHGDLDKKHSELKTKFKEHIKKMKHNISDERKSMIHDRIAEMKAFKSQLRENASEMTDEEKQQLREEFIEKAKDMQLAWIAPRVQIAAGVDASDVECREGYSLVMKTSNGVAMCLKADTALKMIDRGIAVPAN